MAKKTDETKTPNESTDIMTIGGDLGGILAEMAERQAASISTYKLVPQISITHQSAKPKFILPDEDKTEVETLSGVILDFSPTRENYDEGSPVPICTSIGGKFGTTYGMCAKCKDFVWGSGNNGVGRKCKESRRLLLGLEGFTGAFELKLPVTSIAPFETFKNELITKERKPLVFHRVKMSLIHKTEKTKKWSEVKFEKIGTIMDEAEGLQDFRTTIAELLKTYKDHYKPTSGAVALPANVSDAQIISSAPEDSGEEDIDSAATKKAAIGKMFKTGGNSDIPF